MYEKSYILSARTGVRENSTVACWFSPIKIHYSDYPKQINEVYVFFSIKYRSLYNSSILFKTPKLHLNNVYCEIL